MTAKQLLGGLKIIGGRAGYAVIVLLAVLILNFVMIHVAPGDIADTIAGEMGGSDAQVMAQIRADYGLDQPFALQLGRYLGNVLRLDFGHSFFYNRPVTELVVERLPATLLLVFTAQGLALLVGMLLGVVAARHPNGLLSHLVTLLALFGFSAPVFWTGIMLLIAFSLVFGLFPVAGMFNPALDATGWRHLVDVLHHLTLPALTLASVFLALYARTCRASLLEVIDTDYVRTARAKGLLEREVVFKHALKNALGPIITLAGLQFSAVVSGAILVETVFNWPGLGTLALSSIIARDVPTILGILFFSALVVVVGNLLTDLVLRLIDPRIRG